MTLLCFLFLFPGQEGSHFFFVRPLRFFSSKAGKPSFFYYQLPLRCQVFTQGVATRKQTLQRGHRGQFFLSRLFPALQKGQLCTTLCFSERGLLPLWQFFLSRLFLAMQRGSLSLCAFLKRPSGVTSPDNCQNNTALPLLQPSTSHTSSSTTSSSCMVYRRPSSRTATVALLAGFGKSCTSCWMSSWRCQQRTTHRQMDKRRL